MFGISRIESKNTQTWYVRVRREEGLISASFSDGQYGGKRNALKAAKIWRDAKIKGLPEVPRKGITPSLEHPRSTTGVAGVVLEVKRRNGKVLSLLWTAKWRIPNPKRQGPGTIIRTKSFAIQKYGYRGAFLWAVLYRARSIGMEVDLRKLITPPVPKKYLRWLESHKCLNTRVRYKDYVID